MGRTIPSFRIASVLEEKEWKSFRKYLNNKNDKKAFENMFQYQDYTILFVPMLLFLLGYTQL